MWAYGTIYSRRPEINLYQSSLPAVFAATPALYTIVGSPLESLLESLLESISNNASFRLKHPGVPDGSDGSDGTLYRLTENYTLPVTQATCRVAYLPPLLCASYTHHQNDMCVTLFAGAAVML